MKPGFTAAQLQALLSQAFIPKAKFDNVPTYTWCIYPTYQTPDLSDPQVQVAMDPPPGFFPGLLNRPPECAGVPQGLGQAPPPPVTDWIHSLYTRPPEGIEKTVAVEPTQINRPNWSWSVVMGWQYAQDHSWAENNGTLYWRPGTGLFNWLGNLRIHRTTTAYFTGQPPQPEPPRTK